VGDLVKNGELIGILKSYGGEKKILSEISGRISKLIAYNNSDILSGQPLIELEKVSQNLNDTTAKKNDTHTIVVKSGTYPESILSGELRIIKEVGNKVLNDEIIAEIETDKTTMPIMSTSDGYITKYFFENGQDIGPKQNVCEISPNQAQNTIQETPSDKNEISLQNIMSNTPIDESKNESKPSQLTLEEAEKPSTPHEKIKESTKEINQTIFDNKNTPKVNSNEIKYIKMSPIRRKIAKRLKEAQSNAALLTTFNEIDMHQVISLRNKINNDLFEDEGLKLGLLPFFIAALSLAIKKNKLFNAYIEDEYVVQNDQIAISVAVATKKGLFVPVLRDIENKKLLDIERDVRNMAHKANNDRLSVNDMVGGTFTITNGGVFGSLLSTPIVNPPQSSILGLHAIQKRAVVIDDKIEIRPMMYVALTYDHRLFDGNY
ncbi:MAG: hypothetical protein MHPSP_002163, partial [Paramarteilia canceri]